ncbi:MAG: MarR family EPS-associated transcriptional regulator [Pseudomonadota bacterium]
MSNEEVHYKLLKVLHDEPDLSQRELAKRLGISVGKTNYCLKALAEKGLIKAGNFKNNPDKRAYVYLLTPQGVKAKAKATVEFLKRKQTEYEALKREISQLKREVAVVDDS